MLLHPANRGTGNSVRLICLQIKSSILLHYLLQRRGVTDTEAVADDECVHRISHGLNERRLHLVLLHRAALTVVLLELEHAQAYAVEEERIDAEDELIAPTAANVQAPLLPVLDILLPQIPKLRRTTAAISWLKSAPRYSPTCATTLSMALYKRTAKTLQLRRVISTV